MAGRTCPLAEDKSAAAPGIASVRLRTVHELVDMPWLCTNLWEISVETVLWSALLAFLSTVTGQLLLLIRELLLFMINQVMKRI